MDGWGTEGAAASLAWHIVNEVRKFVKPDIRGCDLERIEEALKAVTKELVDLRVQVAKLNGGVK